MKIFKLEIGFINGGYQRVVSETSKCSPRSGPGTNMALSYCYWSSADGDPNCLYDTQPFCLGQRELLLPSAYQYLPPQDLQWLFSSTILAYLTKPSLKALHVAKTAKVVSAMITILKGASAICDTPCMPSFLGVGPASVLKVCVCSHWCHNQQKLCISTATSGVSYSVNLPPALHLAIAFCSPRNAIKARGEC